MNKLFDEISLLDTEKIDKQFSDIDLLETADILHLINEQDALVAGSVRNEIPYITKAVDSIVERFRLNGRLIYVGAGTSGRIGVIDAAECPPTFGVDTDMVQGIIAGGKEGMFYAIEGAEDRQEDAELIIKKINLNGNDIVCGLTASGRTPFVIASLSKAKVLGALTILISTNSRKKITDKGIEADIMICPQVGAEVIAGSTRMKSATAQKMIVNMITTTAMVKMGKTYKNIMIDLQPLNNKLKERAKRIVSLITNISEQEALQILQVTNYNVKLSLVMKLCNIDIIKAQKLINQNCKIREIIK